MVFNDEAAGTKEITANASRIEAWRKTWNRYIVIFVKGFPSGVG